MRSSLIFLFIIIIFFCPYAKIQVFDTIFTLCFRIKMINYSKNVELKRSFIKLLDHLKCCYKEALQGDDDHHRSLGLMLLSFFRYSFYHINLKFRMQALLTCHCNVLKKKVLQNWQNSPYMFFVKKEICGISYQKQRLYNENRHNLNK